MSKLNILLITSDQQHWNTLGQFNPEIQTPALDKLASQGSTFTHAYCPNPTCTPTRASMITGKYPSQHGAYSLGTKLPESEPTVGELFQAAGYRTASRRQSPLSAAAFHRGIPFAGSLPDAARPRLLGGLRGTLLRIRSCRAGAQPHRRSPCRPALRALDGRKRAEQLARLLLAADRQRRVTAQKMADSRALSLQRLDCRTQQRADLTLSRRRGARRVSVYATFFLWASFFDPHPKYLAPEPWDSMYDPADVSVPAVKPGEHDASPPHLQLTQQPNPDFSAWQEPNGGGCHGFHSHLHDRDELAKDIACYYGMVSCMDKYIGQIIDHLDDSGLAENTLVVFTSDHGHYFGQHGLIAKGAFHYDDGLRVPMIARLPGTHPRWPGQPQPAIAGGLRPDLPRLLRT